MKNHIKTILENAGRTCEFDNRSFQTKSINECIENGMVDIRLSPDGKVFTNKNHLDKTGKEKEYNLKVTAFGFVQRVYVSGTIMPNDILITIGDLLNFAPVKTKINATYFESCDCGKCGGKGIIPHFSYYCAGICFKCYGAGKEVNKVSL